MICKCLFFRLLCFLCSPHLLLSSHTFSFSLVLPRRNTDPGSQSRLFSPLPTTVGAFIFIARTSAFSYLLVDSHRIVLDARVFLPRAFALVSQMYILLGPQTGCVHFSGVRAQFTYTADTRAHKQVARTHVREHSLEYMIWKADTR